MKTLAPYLIPILLLLPLLASSFILPSFRPSLSSPSSPVAFRLAAGGGEGNAADLAGKERLKRFLEDASFLGNIRFVCMNDGGILEAVGSFENMACKEISDRGELATFASDDKTFEAHLNLDLVARVDMVQSKAKKGDHDNYVIRFVSGEGKTLLSSMLHREAEAYDEDALEWWDKLKGVFGESQQIQ